MTVPDATVPDGYAPFPYPSRYLDLIGPLFRADADPATVALLLDDRHTNSRGLLHAGVLVAVCDVLMGHAAHEQGDGDGGLVTVSLTTDFVGTARAGDWVTGRAEITRIGRRLAFTGARFSVGERTVLTASGVFAVASSAATGR